MKRLKSVAGDDDLCLNIDDLNRDFDPKEYDRRMKELFNDNYYQKGGNEEDKPEVSDEELQVENWDRTDEESIPKPVQSNNQEEQITKKSKKKNLDYVKLLLNQNQHLILRKKHLNNILMNIINLIVKILLVIHQFDFNIDKLNQMILV